jgi:transposase InsO family protein
VIPDCDHANRPLSLLLEGQSIKRETVARRFRYHYNHEWPKQALDGKTPAEVIQN